MSKVEQIGNSVVRNRRLRRRRFLQVPLGASAVAWVAPELNESRKSHGDGQSPREVFVSAGADRDSEPFQLLDAVFQTKISGKDTEGRCVIFDTIRHKKVGPALHVHTDCDEWFFVRDGEFKVQAGGRIVRLKTGDSLLIPREMPHAFVKTSEGDARLIVMHQPAVRMEEFFRFFSRQADQSHDAFKKIAEQYGMRVLGPGLRPD